MYSTKQISILNEQVTLILRQNLDGTITSFGKYKDNTDYQQFKKDIQNGVVLNDASGNPITGSALTTFIGTLP